MRGSEAPGPARPRGEATDRAAFDFAQVVQHARSVVDTRNATRDVADPAHKIITLGASRGSHNHPEV